MLVCLHIHISRDISYVLTYTLAYYTYNIMFSMPTSPLSYFFPSSSPSSSSSSSSISKSTCSTDSASHSCSLQVSHHAYKNQRHPSRGVSTQPRATHAKYPPLQYSQPRPHLVAGQAPPRLEGFPDPERTSVNVST